VCSIGLFLLLPPTPPPPVFCGSLWLWNMKATCDSYDGEVEDISVDES
jgi:hypothetical protein